MKKCPYCGGDYPDDMTACPIDRTPFEEIRSERVSEAPSQKFPMFALYSENKVPVSLVIVSYLFFFPSAMCFAYVTLVVTFSFLGGLQNILVTLTCIIAAGVGMFFLLLSRGLRRCSPGWRICALVLTWWGFIVIAFNIARYFLAYETPDHESMPLFIFTCALVIIVQIWQYRVLTRPDIRELFCGKPDYSAHLQ